MLVRWLEKTLLLMLVCIHPVFSEENTPPGGQERHLQEINVTEMRLINGMKVVIKPVDFEPGEVFVQLVAPGGYSALERGQRPSGILAAKAALESGLGAYSANELAHVLYRNAIDLNVGIEKTHRFVDVNCTPESLETVFYIFSLIFKEKRLEQDAFESVISKEKEALRRRLLDPDQSFDVMHFALNTENSSTLKPLSLRSIQKVGVEKSREFFKRSFTNPSEFTLAIVGDIDIEKIKPLIKKYLNVLEDDASIKGPVAPAYPSFPSGVTRRIVPMRQKQAAYARITFPLKVPLSHQNMPVLGVANRLIEERLREVIRKQTGKNYGVDVGYELPLYPDSGYVWLTIHYHSPKEKVLKLEELVLDEVRKLRAEEVLQDEFAKSINHQKNVAAFLHKDPCFWQTKLVNYTLWNWDLALISEDATNSYEALKPKDVTAFLGEAVAGDNYTFITVTPESGGK